MALQGNPFLGKLKIPAPDLSRIPETPFESKAPKSSEPFVPSAKPEPKTESVQTGADLGFNRVQNPKPIRVQTGADLGFNRVQNPKLAKPAQELIRAQDPKPIRVQNPTEPYSIRVQNPKPTIPIGQLLVLKYLSSKEERPGNPIRTRRPEIAQATNQTLDGVKSALKRLSQAGLVILGEFKVGKRSGYTTYQLNPTVRDILRHHAALIELGFNRVQTGSIGFPSSSSFLDLKNLKTTTTGEPALFDDARVQIGPEWLEVDTSPLAEIGFSQTHLIQLARHSKLSANEVVSSIEFFAFDLKRNGKAKALSGSPLNFFMGILRKGIPYTPPENYESPADEARRRTREILERKERERRAEEQRIRDLEYAEWRMGLTPSDLARILPEWAQKPGQIQDSALRSHFDEKVWPERKTTRVGSSDSERTEIARQVEQSLEEATR